MAFSMHDMSSVLNDANN